MQHLADRTGTRATVHLFQEHFFGTGPAGAKRVKTLLVDTETNGMELSDEILEIGMVQATWVQTAHDRWALEHVHEYPTQLQQASAPLNPDAQAVHGITEMDLLDKQFDWSLIYQACSSVDCIIAFNAQFDRPRVHSAFVDRKLAPPITPWVCAWKQINWKERPFVAPTEQLTILALWHGFFFTAHRAVKDCQATIHLLNISGTIGQLLECYNKVNYYIFCPKGSFPFADNSKVKAKRFAWSDVQGGWWKLCLSEDERDNILGYLRTEVFGNSANFNRVTVTTVLPSHRFLV